MNGEARCLLYRPHIPTLRQEFRRVERAGEESEPAGKGASERDSQYESTVQDSTEIVDGQESRQKE
jgi:hypothetical protein